MLSYPLSSSTTIFYYNKDAFKKGPGRRQGRPRPGPVFEPPPSSRPAATLPHPTSWMGWTQLELLHWHNTCSPPKNNGPPTATMRSLQINTPACAPLRNLAKASNAGELRLQGPRQQHPPMHPSPPVMRHDPDRPGSGRPVRPRAKERQVCLRVSRPALLPDVKGAPRTPPSVVPACG